MASEVEKKLLKHLEVKEFGIQWLKDIVENKNICLKFIDESIEIINNNIPQYIEGSELRIANERRKPIERSEEENDRFMSFTEKGENVKIDIVLKSIDKELAIGEIDCNVTWIEYSGRRYFVELNYIALNEEYQNKGYGTEILKHIPSIISHLYKGEIVRVKTTPEVIKYDKYKIHEITYNQRIKEIEAWLIRNEYKPNGIFFKETGLEFYEVDLEHNKGIDHYMSQFKNSLLDVLSSSTKNTYLRNEYIEDCESMLKIICKNKYSDGIAQKKLLKLHEIRETIDKSYDTLKENIEYTIFSIDEVKKLYNEITLEDLKINKDDKVDEIAIKLYCKYFNLGTVGKIMEEMGYKTKKKGTTQDRKYTYAELKEMISNSNTENKKLKDYVDYIFIANDGCVNL